MLCWCAIFIIEFPLIKHFIWLEDDVRWVLFFWNDSLRIYLILLIYIVVISIALTQKFDNILDDLINNLLFLFELSPQFLLKPFILDCQKLILLIKFNTNLLQLILTNSHLINHPFKRERNFLTTQWNYWGKTIVDIISFE